MHVGQGRRTPLHVDYIFLGVCLGYIQDSLLEAILSHPQLTLRRKIAIVKSVNKVIWIQNDLLARWHTKDGAEYAAELDAEAIKAEPEESSAYSANKNDHPTPVPYPLSTVPEDSASIGTSSSGKTSLGRSLDDIEVRDMRCPFSGMAWEQRAEMTRPMLKTILDEKQEVNLPPSGIPKLRLVDGKVVCKEKLEKDPWGVNIGKAL